MTPVRPTNTNLQLLPVHHPGAFQFANRDLTLLGGWGGLGAASFQSSQGAMCLVVMLHTKGCLHIRECSFFPPVSYLRQMREHLVLLGREVARAQIYHTTAGKGAPRNY